jgi:hypothetical protein
MLVEVFEDRHRFSRGLHTIFTRMGMSHRLSSVTKILGEANGIKVFASMDES